MRLGIMCALMLVVLTGCGASDSAVVTPEKAIFVGNSILTGNGGSGMCASDPAHDYFAIVNERMAEGGTPLDATKVRGVLWEWAMTTDGHQEWLLSVAPIFTEDTDLVVIQLGDNVCEKAHVIFEDGVNGFIDFVQERCPNAQVLWVGPWFLDKTHTKRPILDRVCREQGITFVDIFRLNTTDGQAKIGQTVKFLDGATSTVTDPIVAEHPGDVGMERIAEAILGALK